jgi:hypothetical protein
MNAVLACLKTPNVRSFPCLGVFLKGFQSHLRCGRSTKTPTIRKEIRNKPETLIEKMIIAFKNRTAGKKLSDVRAAFGKTF